MRLRFVDGLTDIKVEQDTSTESHWIDDGGRLNIVYKWQCAVCGNREREKRNYCSYCGRRMTNSKSYEAKKE